MAQRRAQRGYFLLIALLLALLLVAWLASSALKNYGAVTSAPPAPGTAPLDRAKELGESINRQAVERAAQEPK